MIIFSPLDPPGWDDSRYMLEDNTCEPPPDPNMPLIVEPEEVNDKYVDPTLILKIGKYLRKQSIAHKYLIEEFKKTIDDLKVKLWELECRVIGLTPTKEEPEEKEQPMKLNKISRKSWGAANLDDDDVARLEEFETPASKVHISYSTGQEECEMPDVCKQRVKWLQLKAMGTGLPDIPYNFVIGLDGNVYEGRGWEIKPEISTTDKEKFKGVIDIAFIGNYTAKDHPYELMYLLDDALMDGIKKGHLEKKFEIMNPP